MSLISYCVPTTCYCFVFVILFLCLPSLSHANGSARLIEPAMRSSLWRFNPKATVNFNDHALDCGGPQIQFNLNRGRCGVCGDPYNELRENEKGGKYGSGIIARRYRTGTKVTMIADLVAGNGGGFFEVKLCPRNSPRARVTQACFDKYPLQITNGSGKRKRRLRIPENTRNPNGLYRLDVKLPKGVACTHCILQWHYHAANEWGYDSNGRGCMGCGPQTEIYNCADVTIGYYGDAEAKLGPTSDLSVGSLAQVYDTYSNGKYGTGVSPILVNSGVNTGWASANDLTRASDSDGNMNNYINENTEADDDQQQPPQFGIQASGFANLFLGEGFNDNIMNDMMPLNDYYGDYYQDYQDGLDYGVGDLTSMMPLLGGGAGGQSGEGGSGFSQNFARIAYQNQRQNRRNFGGGGGGGSSGSSEEGGGRYRASNSRRRGNAMNIPSITLQYNRMNGGGSSDSSEEGGGRGGGMNIVIDRQNNFRRIQDALREIANRQKLRNGLHDLVEQLENRNRGNDDYYYDNGPTARFGGGGGSSSGSSEEGFNPGNIPNYFKNQGGGGSSSCESSEECGGRQVVVDYYPDEPEVYDTEPQVPEPEITLPPLTTDDYYTDPIPTEPPVPTTPDPYYDDMGPSRGDAFIDGAAGPGGDYPAPSQEDLDFIARRQAELDRWKEIEEEERLKRMRERVDQWRPSMSPVPWPYNYQSGVFTQQNPYNNFGNGMNLNNMNMNNILNPQIPQTLSRQYPPWQIPNMMSAMTSQPSSVLTQQFSSPYANALGLSSSSPATSSLDQIFPWMPSANDVMTMGASKSPIFSQKVANQYLSPFLALSQSHPSLQCQRPDQLICVATPSYRNIPNADGICTTKCRSGGSCGSDYCSCACQKSLMCVHHSSAPGQFGVTELDMWCTDQCNNGQCPDQVCACSIVF